MGEQQRGRPRGFTESAVLDRAVDVFWANGAGRATTRLLEAELQMGQSSIYNAFGSKTELLHRSLDHYLDRVDAELLRPLTERGCGSVGVVDFIRRLVDWISDPAHPGCLMLNVVAETGRHDSVVLERSSAYRARLRSALTRALGGEVATVEVVLAGVLGLNMAAAAGAERTELDSMAGSLCEFVQSRSEASTRG